MYAHMHSREIGTRPTNENFGHAFATATAKMSSE